VLVLSLHRLFDCYVIFLLVHLYPKVKRQQPLITHVKLTCHLFLEFLNLNWILSFHNQIININTKYHCILPTAPLINSCFTWALAEPKLSQAFIQLDILSSWSLPQAIQCFAKLEYHLLLSLLHIALWLTDIYFFLKFSI